MLKKIKEVRSRIDAIHLVLLSFVNYSEDESARQRHLQSKRKEDEKVGLLLESTEDALTEQWETLENDKRLYEANKRRYEDDKRNYEDRLKALNSRLNTLQNEERKLENEKKNRQRGYTF